MTEPITTNRYLIVPNTGDLPGTWGTAALNPNFSIIDTLFGGVVTISLSSATTILLTTPATTGVWAGVAGQSSNALIRFTGAQTGSAVIQFTLPGFYIIDNRCTGTTYVQLAPATGTGNRIGAPPGQKVQVFFDGTDMDYVNLGKVGERVDIHGISTTQPWMQACTVQPYLVRDGLVYSTSMYPQLAALLGSTFGGNGVTQFGVPDSRSRLDLPLDTINPNSGVRASVVTSTGSGISGMTMAAIGGSQFLQNHNHTASVTDPGHVHPEVADGGGGVSNRLVVALGNASNSVLGLTTASATTNVTVGVNGTGSGTFQNMPPSVVSHLPLIKT